MIIGMSTATFTLLHVIISLIGIFTGLVVAAGLWGGKRLDTWTGIFLLTTVLTSLTGFMFPGPVDPARVVGVISLVVLAIAILAFYVYHVAGAVALDLRHHGLDLPLPELLRRRGAIIPEDSGAARVGAQGE